MCSWLNHHRRSHPFPISFNPISFAWQTHANSRSPHSDLLHGCRKSLHSSMPELRFRNGFCSERNKPWDRHSQLLQSPAKSVFAGMPQCHGPVIGRGSCGCKQKFGAMFEMSYFTLYTAVPSTLVGCCCCVFHVMGQDPVSHQPPCEFSGPVGM